MYTCSVCHKPVAVLKNTIVRSCVCVGPIIADMRAAMKGAGGVKAGSGRTS